MSYFLLLLKTCWFLKLNEKYGPDLFITGVPSCARLDRLLARVEAVAVDPTDMHWLYFEKVWPPN